MNNLIKEHWSVIEEKIIKPIYEDGYFPLTLADEVTKILTQQLNNGWIPVLERFPNKEEYFDQYNNTKELLITTTDGEVKVAEFYDKIFFTTQRLMHHEKENVIAWRTLPEPYKEDNDAEFKI